MLKKTEEKVVKIIVSLIVLAISFLGFLGSIHAQEIDYPDYVGYVNDFAQILDSDSVYDLETLIADIEEETRAEIAVVTIDSLEGITIEEYAAELFEKWGIGKADEDNGLLILISLMEREVRIEVGYGLEGVITDLEAGRIIEEIIVPDFKNEEYDSGIYKAVAVISNQIYGEEKIADISERQNYSLELEEFLSELPPGFLSWFPVSIIILLFSIFSSGFLCVFVILIILFLIIFPFILFRRKCPKCRRFRALIIKVKILKSATFAYPGKRSVERTCKYCGFHDKRVEKIPRRTRSYSSSSSG